MPVNSISEGNKGLKIKKLSLSLSKRSAPYPSNAGINERSTQIFEDKENKPLKRSSNSIYNKTLNAAKKLKVVEESKILAGLCERNNITITPIASGSSSLAMLNGHQAEGGQFSGNAAPKPSNKTPIATLANLGNTCFLNSVLYTLRYAPRFLHSLHHLVSDLASVDQKLGSIRLKSSSLGRSAAGLASTGARSWSSKDLLSLGQSESSAGKSKIQLATERLHETFTSLRAAETKCLNSNSSDTSPEPFAADAFLCALREVNSTFEGNRQQDAHELLVCILDHIRETCRALSQRVNRMKHLENGDSNGIGRQPSIEDGKTSLGNLRKSWKKKPKEVKIERKCSPTEDRAPSPLDIEREERNKPGWDFVADDFEGTMVVRTTCLECETVTENKQAMCDICIPVVDDEEPMSDDDTDPFRAACLSCELLRDQNKYWCERCLRYNEARRSVTYSRLPRLLVLQLKRFSGGMEKITRHVPTPLLLPCFCEQCVSGPNRRVEQPLHRYILWAVIMHLGQSLSGGHYVAYARDVHPDIKCQRENTTDSTNMSSSSFMKTLFQRPRPSPTVGCAARDCCVPRPRSDSCWLACDDDLVKPISNQEFQELLSAEPKMRSAATPYLLFYVKCEVG